MLEKLLKTHGLWSEGRIVECELHGMNSYIIQKRLKHHDKALEARLDIAVGHS